LQETNSSHLSHLYFELSDKVSYLYNADIKFNKSNLDDYRSYASYPENK